MAGSPSKVPENFSFLTFVVKLVFLRLWQVFTEAPIFHHSDLEYHIQIMTNASDNIIGGILSQLTSE